MTPEEYETIITCVEELKANAKVYALEFGLFATAFSYWQRRFIPRSFLLFSVFMGASTGFFYGAIRTGWFFAE